MHMQVSEILGTVIVILETKKGKVANEIFRINKYKRKIKQIQ